MYKTMATILVCLIGLMVSELLGRYWVNRQTTESLVIFLGFFFTFLGFLIFITYRGLK